MECRRTQGTAVVGALQSPPSVSQRPQQQLQLQPHQLHRRRRMHEYDCNDEYNNNNNNNNNSNNSSSNRNNVSATSINNNSVTTTTTLLVDELEQLRTDNFQLRLRVYNAERRVDRLSAVAALDRDRNKRRSDSQTSSSDSSSSSSSSADDDCAQKAAAATATAAAAVRTIHDLLTVNRRLLALLAATVSAKAVAVSPDDKRRWRRLRNHIEDYSAATNHQDDGEEDEEVDGRQEGDDSSDASTSESETCTTNVQTAKAPSAENATPATGTRLRSPPPPQPCEPDRPPAPGDDSAGSELSRLRARCRRLERSLQQLVNTELWARNRQIGKLEQQRYVTQVAAAQNTEQAGRPTAAVTHRQQQQPQQKQCACPTVTLPAATTKGILVVRSPESAYRVTAPEVTAAAATITTPPPVLPDYSEVNFFFSCDEEEDDDQRNSETNTLSSASIGDDTESDDVRPLERLPATAVRAVTVGGAPVHVQPRKRQCRPHHHQQQQRSQRRVVEAATTTSSSTDCAAAVANGGPTSDLCDGDRGATPPPTPHRTFSGTGGRQRPRRRRYRQRRCSGCARRFDDGHPVAGATSPPTAAVADAQVQCSDGESAATGDGDVRATVAQLRRELDARRRENCRLYDMLLRRRKGRDGPSASFLDDDDDAATDSNADGSPEPYRRAARAVRGRIADLLPPLLSMRSTVDGLGARFQQDEDDRGTEQGRLPRDDRQAMTLARLRERIEAYERQQLGGRDDDDLQHVTFGPDASGDPAEDDVLRMDRAALVNVALPRAVDRLRRAILQRLPEEQQPTGQDDPTADLRTLQLQQGLSSVDYNDVDGHRVER